MTKEPKDQNQDPSSEGYVEGKFLVAMPAMEDPRFHQSIVYILEHDKAGAMGLMINKTLDHLKFKDLLEQLSIDYNDECPELDIHYGGPVDIGRGFVIHSKDVMFDHTIDIGPFAVSTSTEMLQAIAQGSGPDEIIFTLGYAGWNAEQLDTELLSDSWLCLDCCYDTVFNTEPKQKWKLALEKSGIHHQHLHDCSGHA